jgi:glycosyltransferase involved in cell wall biosynthesis
MNVNAATEKPDIALITHPFDNDVARMMMTNFVDVLRPVSGDVYVVTGRFSYTADTGIHIIRVAADEGPAATVKRIWRYLVVQVKVAGQVVRLRKKVDIMIFSIGTKTYLLPLLAARLLGKKTVVCTTGIGYEAGAEMYRGTWFGMGRVLLPRIWACLENTGYRLADRVAVQTPHIIDYLKLKKRRDRVSVASGRYTDTDIFSIKIPNSRRDPVIGFAGRLSEEKGILNFVGALPVLKSRVPGVRFLIAGPGPLADEVASRLERYGVDGETRLTGWVPHEELPGYLNEMKVLVLPSYSEGLPGVVKEAMASGAVVVATRVGSVPDLIRDGETGFLLDDNTPETIAAGVRRALDHPDLDGLAKRAREIVVREHSFDAAVAQYRELFSLMSGAK